MEQKPYHMLEKIEAELLKRNMNLSEILADGISKEEIDNILATEKLVPSDFIYSLYSWKNGNKNGLDSQYFEVFYIGQLLSLQDSLTMYKVALSNELYDKQLFPITWRHGDFLLYNIDPKSQDFDSIFLYSPPLGSFDELFRMYDTSQSFLETTLLALKENIFFYENGEKVTTDDIFEIGKSLNPISNYWIQ